MHVRMEALSGMVGNSTTFQTQESQTIVCEPAPHPSRALHSHSLFVPTALEDHNTSVRNTANKETVTWEFGICRANREVSKSICACSCIGDLDK